ncbi:SIMPL domain-containing protein [Mangrovibacterium diazotrophicum]|uniref:SIMPL domain-containing protein n=1 Tax=Mangrovibacterium diazotrophicum TaxID=1261403 RepID=A0A419VV51_9BACT|nr:SIMPL domain-containing protein [Mangrovibacterium diazotrophicum]RKD86034.1 hypothetical protein BC643_4350 [Mangrovibacterium diazotrophicum]
MKKLLSILLLILSIGMVEAQESGKNFIDQNYIEVGGHAEKQVAPDLIYLKILLNEKEIKGKTLSEVEGEMYSKLEEIGIDVEKELVVRDFVSNFQFYLLRKTDILMSKEYQLLVHDAKTVGQVYLELGELGISNISIDKLDNSSIEKYRDEVKVEAIKAAKSKADALAQALGQETGRALYISDNGTNASFALTGAVAGVRVRGAKSTIYGSSAPPNIEFEKMELKYDLLVRFELK